MNCGGGHDNNVGIEPLPLQPCLHFAEQFKPWNILASAERSYLDYMKFDILLRHIWTLM